MISAPTTATTLTAAAPASPPPKVRHPLAVTHFRNLWIGSTVSLLGDQFYLVALPWLVLQLTASSVVLGTVLMTAAIPRAFFGALLATTSALTVSGRAAREID